MTSEWHDFFFAVICSTGSLLGLLFVAISICVPKIVASSNLHKASMQPLALLLSILVVSTYFLIPDQLPWVLASEIFFTGLIIGGGLLSNNLAVYKRTSKKMKTRVFINLLLNMVSPVLILISGITIFTSGKAGIYFMVPAIILSYVKVAVTAWAMLIEVHRHATNNWWDVEVNEIEKMDE